jgi:hypothetical protein
MPLGESVPTIPGIVMLLSSRGQAAQIVIKDERNTKLRNVDNYSTNATALRSRKLEYSITPPRGPQS